MPKYSADIFTSESGRMPVVVETDSIWNAEKLIKTQYPGYDICSLSEIKADEIHASGTETHTQSRATSLKEAGLAFVLVIAIYFGYAFYQNYSADNTHAEAASRIDQKPESLLSPKDSLADTARVDIQPPTAPETTPSALSDPGRDKDFPFRARLVDSRGVVVLQSGPGITSRNVTRLDAGNLIRAESVDGKWIRVKTNDGLVGFVRAKQLEFISSE